MAKSKNHTNHNQNYKAHRNGIFLVKRTLYISNRGQNQKLIRNTRYARKFDPSIKKPVNLTKKIAKVKQLRASGAAKAPVKKAPAKDEKKEAPKKDAPKKDEKKDAPKKEEKKDAPKKEEKKEAKK